jgi:hypothetical protein
MGGNFIDIGYEWDTIYERKQLNRRIEINNQLIKNAGHCSN